jgi:lysophospholipase L1-like esterase
MISKDLAQHSKNPFYKVTIANVFCTIAIIVSSIGLFEITASLMFPFPMAVSGFVHTPNGRLYGWGFAPGQLVRTIDPDTGTNYVDRVNSRGWRDGEHNFQKPKGVFRIVVLGDSQTFGQIVAAQSVFSRVLEKNLQKKGANVEVINISYPGWGTDQQFQALKLEAIRYDPDLVIFHFVSNDIQDNLWHLDEGKFGRKKPFYFSVGKNGLADIHVNRRFEETWSHISRNQVISKSEILKRAWSLRQAWRERKKQENAKKIRFIPRQIPAIKNLLDRVDRTSALADFNSLITAGSFSKETFDKLIETHGLIEVRNPLWKMAQNTASFFVWAWSGASFDTGRLYMPKSRWDLYFSLMKSANAFANEHNIKIAVSVDHDRGLFDWYLNLGLFEDTKRTRSGFKENIRPLYEFLATEDIPSIPNKRQLTRATRDQHINADGNQALALNISDFVISQFPTLATETDALP